MSPSVYAVLRENLSPTTIETAVCSLSFSLPVKVIPNEVEVVCESNGLKFWAVRKQFISMTQGMSIQSCVLLVLLTPKADTFTYLNCFKFFLSQATTGQNIPVPALKCTSPTIGPTNPYHSLHFSIQHKLVNSYKPSLILILAVKHRKSQLFLINCYLPDSPRSFFT